MYDMGEPIGKIVAYTGLPEEQVKHLSGQGL